MIETDLKRIADALETMANYYTLITERMVEVDKIIKEVPIPVADKIVVGEFDTAEPEHEEAESVEQPKPKKARKKKAEPEPETTPTPEAADDVPWEGEPKASFGKKKVKPEISEPTAEEPKVIRVNMADLAESKSEPEPEEKAEPEPKKESKSEPKKDPKAAPAKKMPKVIIEEDEDDLDGWF